MDPPSHTGLFATTFNCSKIVAHKKAPGIIRNEEYNYYKEYVAVPGRNYLKGSFLRVFNLAILANSPFFWLKLVLTDIKFIATILKIKKSK